MFQIKLFAVLLIANACNGNKSVTADNDTIRTKPGTTFEIKLGAVMGTGFRWMMSADTAYKEYIRSDTSYTVQSKDIDGEPETQIFVFTGLKKGSAILHFLYRRSWKKNDPPDKIRDVTIIIE